MCILQAATLGEALRSLRHYRLVDNGDREAGLRVYIEKCDAVIRQYCQSAAAHDCVVDAGPSPRQIEPPRQPLDYFWRTRKRHS